MLKSDENIADARCCFFLIFTEKNLKNTQSESADIFKNKFKALKLIYLKNKYISQNLLFFIKVLKI